MTGQRRRTAEALERVLLARRAVREGLARSAIHSVVPKGRTSSRPETAEEQAPRVAATAWDDARALRELAVALEELARAVAPGVHGTDGTRDGHLVTIEEHVDGYHLQARSRAALEHDAWQAGLLARLFPHVVVDESLPPGTIEVRTRGAGDRQGAPLGSVVYDEGRAPGGSWPSEPPVDREPFLAPSREPGRLGSWPVDDSVRRDPSGDRRSRALTQGRGRLDG